MGAGVKWAFSPISFCVGEKHSQFLAFRILAGEFRIRDWDWCLRPSFPLSLVYNPLDSMDTFSLASSDSEFDMARSPCGSRWVVCMPATDQVGKLPDSGVWYEEVYLPIDLKSHSLMLAHF